MNIKIKLNIFSHNKLKFQARKGIFDNNKVFFKKHMSLE